MQVPSLSHCYYALARFSLLVMILAVVLTRLAQSFMKRRVAINKTTDWRLNRTCKITQEVRLVKYYAWEASFLNRVHTIRQQEITSLQALTGIRNFVNATLYLYLFSRPCCVLLRALRKKKKAKVLGPAPVFSSVALFNGLRTPLNLLPAIMSQVVGALSFTYSKD